MTVGRGTALALGLVAVFALITFSVVRARDPIDVDVTRSFESTATRLAVLGCGEISLNHYQCGALVPDPDSSGATEASYLLTLRDDGCWTALEEREEPPANVPLELQGCLDE